MRKVAYTLFTLVCLIQCSEFEVIDGIQFRQYADSVIDFSSQYSSGNWSANRALGKENVYPNYGDIPNAWASQYADTKREYLVLGIDTLQTIRIIEIYETLNPGAVDTVYIRNANTQTWERIYSKPTITNLPTVARKFTIFMALETTYMVDAIRIAINSPEVPGWNEIDAVALTGQRSKQE